MFGFHWHFDWQAKCSEKKNLQAQYNLYLFIFNHLHLHLSLQLVWSFYNLVFLIFEKFEKLKTKQRKKTNLLCTSSQIDQTRRAKLNFRHNLQSFHPHSARMAKTNPKCLSQWQFYELFQHKCTISPKTCNGLSIPVPKLQLHLHLKWPLTPLVLCTWNTKCKSLWSCLVGSVLLTMMEFSSLGLTVPQSWILQEIHSILGVKLEILCLHRVSKAKPELQQTWLVD